MNLDGLPYILQPMRLADVPTVAIIERQVFTTPWSPQAFRHEILYHETASYLVLRYTDCEALPSKRFLRPWAKRHDHALVGYGGVWMIEEQAHISTLALRPAWRGRGLGELLFAALLEQAIEQGAETATLEVRVSNERAQSLYAKYGFEIVGRRKRYYPDNQEDAWIMTVPFIQSDVYQRMYHGLVDKLLSRLRAASHTVPDNKRSTHSIDRTHPA